MNKRYALLGAAGFIAPRHMKAIKETGGELVAACDPHDSVGILDSMFPECLYFREFERFMRFIDMDGAIDYVVICTPNYLHDSQVKICLRQGCDVICEKPVVINPWNLRQLISDEDGLDNGTNVILQMRLHPEIIKLKENLVSTCLPESKHVVNLKYVTPRGSWYDSSWKGDADKSGGLLVNIGVHLFDMLGFVFGKPVFYSSGVLNERFANGFIEFENAEVSYMLSLDDTSKPDDKIGNPGAYREMIVDGTRIDFSDITGLHTNSYRKILTEDGFPLYSCIDSCVITTAIREGLKLNDVYDEYFPWWKRVQ
jgi:UDP-N-acetyl-2-amino-2-deoxyglucuronate dehydrogenase